MLSDLLVAWGCLSCAVCVGGCVARLFLLDDVCVFISSLFYCRMFL